MSLSPVLFLQKMEEHDFEHLVRFQAIVDTPYLVTNPFPLSHIHHSGFPLVDYIIDVPHNVVVIFSFQLVLSRFPTTSTDLFASPWFC